MTERRLSAGTETVSFPFGVPARINSLPVILILLTALGLAARLLFLSEPLQGDEYNSLNTAATWSSQVNGWLYYILLHVWTQLGAADWWYRLLSIAIGVLAIPLAYSIGAHTVDLRTGLVFAAFAAVSPYAIELSLRIRHYSLYLTASFFALTAALYYLRAPEDRRRLLLFVLSLLLLTLSHLFGVILALALLLYIYVRLGPWPARSKVRLAIVLSLLLAGLSFLLWPAARDTGWAWLLDAIGALNRVDYHSIRGLSPAQFAKIGITFFVFALGYYVYPLQWPIVIPALLLFAASTLIGLLVLWRAGKVILPLLLLSLVAFLFLVLEPLVPPLTETASPRHLAMAWPAFGLLVSTGIGYFGRGKFAPLLVLLSAVAISFSLSGDWSYGLSGPDWRAAAAYAQSSGTLSETALLHDGRSSQATERYFPEVLPRIDLWSLDVETTSAEHSGYSRLILTTLDYRTESRRNLNQLLAQLDNGFDWTTGHVDYPFFEYVLTKSDAPGHAVNAETGQIYQPLRLYGIEFQDLDLPLDLTFAGTELETLGSFYLPDLTGLHRQDIPLQRAISGSELVLLSNVLNSEAADSQSAIAEVTIRTAAGEIWAMPIRLGYETEDWSRTCAGDAPCSTIYRWHKRVALVGQRAYADAWRDFDAGIHATSIELPRSAEVESIMLEYLADAGQLHVWGIAVLP